MTELSESIDGYTTQIMRALSTLARAAAVDLERAGIKAEALRAVERNYGQAPSDSRPGGES